MIHGGQTMKETLREQLKRLEAENERLSKNFNDCFAENQQLQKKLNAKIESTDEYQRNARQLQEMEQQRDAVMGQRDHYHAKVLQLEAERDSLRQQLADLQATYEALKATHERTCRESQRNPFGAGRKRSYTAQLEQIMQLRESGSSIRSIASELNIPFATVARYIRENESK